MNRAELQAWITSAYSVDPDYPWKDGSDMPVFRHPNNRKWFALVASVPREKMGLKGPGQIDIVDLKCNPLLIGSLVAETGIFPAWHMSKSQWISVALDGSVPDERLQFLVDLSYDLTSDKSKKSKAPVFPEKLEFRSVSVDCDDARELINELNNVLTGLVGHNGAKHFHQQDFYGRRALFLIGYHNGVPVCCAGLRKMDETRCEVKRVYARKNRIGSGTQLIAELEKHAREFGYSAMLLESSETNTHAIGFYKRQGFTVCKNYPPYVGVDYAVCMMKKIK